MQTIELKPGQNLSILYHSSELGEVKVAYTYDQLLAALRAKQKKNGRSKKSTTQGAYFSRLIGLYVAALKNGQWNSGKIIDRYETGLTLLALIKDMSDANILDLTPTAVTRLKTVQKFPHELLPVLETELHRIDEIRS